VALGSSSVIAGSNVFIENGAIGTVEGVLLSIGMTQVVNLTTCFLVSIEGVIVSASAVKGCVGFFSNDFHWTDFFGFVWLVVQKDWSLGLVGLRRTIARLWRPIGWFWMSI